MKVSGAKQVHYDSGPNMTPLVDVVMVILIFLMLAGSFGSDEHYMVSKTPMHLTGGGNKTVDLTAVATTTIEVRVNRDGTFTVPSSDENSRAVQTLDDPKKFRAWLEDKSGKYMKAGTLDNVEIVLRPTADTKWHSIAPLYAAALEANYNKVAFAMVGSR